jgi:hypothetical protein
MSRPTDRPQSERWQRTTAIRLNSTTLDLKFVASHLAAAISTVHHIIDPRNTPAVNWMGARPAAASSTVETARSTTAMDVRQLAIRDGHRPQLRTRRAADEAVDEVGQCGAESVAKAVPRPCSAKLLMTTILMRRSEALSGKIRSHRRRRCWNRRSWPRRQRCCARHSIGGTGGFIYGQQTRTKRRPNQFAVFCDDTRHPLSL